MTATLRTRFTALRAPALAAALLPLAAGAAAAQLGSFNPPPGPAGVYAVTNARIVGRTTARGRPALVITFFDPKTPGWFRVVVDRDTFRTYDLHMVATAHFMHDCMHSFDRTAPIRPPVR